MANLLKSMYDSGLAEAMRTSLLGFPLVETVHVVAITLVVGTVLIVDLRLLGLASGQRAYTRVSSDLLKWTWIGFAVALVTGLIMFSSNAMVYFENTALRIKFALMLAAGINMVIFHFLSEKSVRDDRSAGPAAAKIAAILSLCLWVGVVVAGRWAGFTLAGKTDAGAAADMNFDDFLGGGDPAAPPAPAPVK